MQLIKNLLVLLVIHCSLGIAAQEPIVYIDVKSALKEAHKGNTDAMRVLYMLFLEGKNVATDSASAYFWMEKAAKSGNHHAMWDWAVYQKNIIKDSVTTVFWLKAAAGKGNFNALETMGNMYMTGYYVPRDSMEALRYFVTAASNGHIPSMVTLGDLYGDGIEIPKDHARAMEWYRKAANTGNYHAMNILGLRLLEGNIVKRDDLEARKLFSKTAGRGSAEGYFYLGRMYEHGWGVKRKDKKALEYYLLSIKSSKESDAWYKVGIFYEQGRGGLKPDYKKAVEHYKQSSDNGHPIGMFYMAKYYNSIDKKLQALQMNEKVFYILFQRIHSSFVQPEELICLGQLFEEGRVVKKDLKRAKELYDQAALLQSRETREF